MRRVVAVIAATLLVLVGFSSVITPSASLPNGSQKVALVPNGSGSGTYGGGNGGDFPTSSFPGGYAPTFTDVTPESIRDDGSDPLAAYDTVVLVQFCTIGDYLANATFKSRLEGFVAGGGKLLIWDSECEDTDYSKFVYPFTTSNPGAAGAQGTLTIVEENDLSSNDSTRASYVNASVVSDDTDAVGDANVFVTFSSEWFADMKATNILGVNGPVQAYAAYGNGLIIYQGLDMDYLEDVDYTYDPASTSGDEQLARIWLLQLMLGWNPDNLPGGVRVFGLSLAPATASLDAGATHTLTATATANAEPQAGIEVTFTVISGPNSGTAKKVTTGGDGKATFSYTGGATGGTDVIEATATIKEKAVSAKAEVVWKAPEVLPLIVRNGYLMAAEDGGVFASGFGDAKFFGALEAEHHPVLAPQSLRILNAEIVGVALSETRNGYWLTAADGGVFAIGDAAFAGSLGNRKLNAPITGIGPDPDGKGYWLVAEDGGVFAFDAPYYGSLGGKPLNKRIVDMLRTPTGKGYWLVAEDGGVFGFGDAVFSGSLGSMKLNAPIVGMAADKDGTGYWLVARDGGVFSFAATFHGSMAGKKLNAPVIGIAPDPDGKGYWLAAMDGGIFALDAPFHGSVARQTLNQPMTAVVPT